MLRRISAAGRARVVGEVLVAAFGVALVAWALRADDLWVQVHLTPHYCIVDPTTLPKVHAVRWVAAVVGALVAFIVRPLVGNRLRGRTLRSVAAPTGRVIVAVVLAFVVVDGGLRVVRARRTRNAVAPPPVRLLDHEHSDSMDVVVSGRTVHYALNADGFRTRTEQDVVDRHAPTIIFSGESVVLGYGLHFDETISARVAAATGIATANLGLSGVAQGQALLHLKRWLPSFERPIAVVSFVVYTWLERDLRQDSFHFARGADGRAELVTRTRPELLSSSPLYQLLTAAVPYKDDDVVGVLRSLLQQTNELIKARGAQPLFVFTPCGPRCRVAPGEPVPPVVQEAREGLELRSIDLDIGEANSLPGDLHPSPAGAELYAGAITRALREAAVVE